MYTDTTCVTWNEYGGGEFIVILSQENWRKSIIVYPMMP